MNSVAFNSDETYQYLKHLLQDVFGVVLGEDQEQQVTDKLDSVMADNDIDTLQSLTLLLHATGSSGLRTEVLHAITEHIKNWFAYPDIMAMFSQYVLPNISQNSAKPFRVWLVGCGNGQTAYSLAIAADKYMQQEQVEIPIEILATDSSETTVNEAINARYKSSFMFGLSDADKLKYMTLKKSDSHIDEWVVNDNIKSKVSFSVGNPLYIDEKAITDVDLIICPDVLVYYMVDAKKQVLEAFAGLLSDTGMLMAGAHEPIIPFCNQYTMVEHELGTFYRKQN